MSRLYLPVPALPVVKQPARGGIIMNDLKIGPECIRCGLCCIAAPCDDNPTCKALWINDDLTTTCMSKPTVEYMVGSGCATRGMDERCNLLPGMSIYQANKEMYDLDNTKKARLELQKARQRGVWAWIKRKYKSLYDSASEWHSST